MDRHMPGGVKSRVAILSLAVALALVALVPLPARAQSSLSTIHGTVKDESGAAMPGVNVTLTSPEMQVGKVSAVTESDGNYRFGELPAGTLPDLLRAVRI